MILNVPLGEENGSVEDFKEKQLLQSIVVAVAVAVQAALTEIPSQYKSSSF